MHDDRATPIDLGHLSEQTFGNADLETEVLRLFLKQSRDCLDRLETAPDPGTAHRLVGSARGIGAGLHGVIGLSRRPESAPDP